MNILSWNVGGLYNKLGSTDFRNYIGQFMILGFTETWVTKEPPTIDGFVLVEFREAKKKVQVACGRASGGLAVYVAETMKDLVDPITVKITTHNIIWIKIKSKMQTVCSFVYNPPSESGYAKRNFFDILKTNLDELLPLSQQNEIVIMGDMNARTGALEDCVPVAKHECVEWDTELYEPGARNNRDSTTNSNGKKLIQFCQETGFFIGNGRFDGDEQGDYTFISHRGKSVIDYCLVTPGSIKHVKHFRVDDRTESDHQPLVIEINSGCGIREATDETSDMIDAEVTMIDRYVYNEDKHEQIEKRWIEYYVFICGLINIFLVDGPVVSESVHCPGPLLNISDCVLTLHALLQTVLSPLKKVRKDHSSHGQASPTEAIKELQSKVKSALRKCRSDQSEQSLDLYISKKASYTLLVQETKRLEKEEFAANITELYASKDLKNLWRIIKKSVSGNKASPAKIPVNKLICHFGKVF